MKAVEVRENTNVGLRYAFREGGGIFVQGVTKDPHRDPWLRTRMTRWDVDEMRRRSKQVDLSPELPGGR
ncbi:MAG: hypothetical protein KGL35_05215 [Bradyrhizobium sp.]|nr:hypothetical protein [Bradyrhizobium sp.]